MIYNSGGPIYSVLDGKTPPPCIYLNSSMNTGSKGPHWVLYSGPDTCPGETTACSEPVNDADGNPSSDACVVESDSGTRVPRTRTYVCVCTGDNPCNSYCDTCDSWGVYIDGCPGSTRYSSDTCDGSC